MRVFCTKCKHLHYVVDSNHYRNECEKIFSNIKYECLHPENCDERFDWYNSYLISKEDPCKLNKDNDCKWYEKGETK